MEVLYNGRHVTGSPFHQEIFDPHKVKLESAKKSGFVGDEMSLDSMYIGISFLDLQTVADKEHEQILCYYY